MKPGDPDWPTLDNGQPVPPNRRDEPCGNCNRLGHPCHHHGDDDTPAAGGRPTKLTPDRREEILDAARIGTTMEGCARAAGIGVSTLYEWLSRGDDGEEPYAEFSEAFKRARAKGEQRLVAQVHQSKPEFILERSYGYVKTERRELSVPDAGGAEVKVYDLKGVDLPDPDGQDEEEAEAG